MADRAPAIARPTDADEVARPARDPATAPHADIGGPVAGRSRPGLTGHVGHDRRVLRSLQRKAGNLAVGSLVPAGSPQPTIQRQTDEEKKLLADEELAWSAAKAKVGAEALFVTHEDPYATVRLWDRPPETSTLWVGSPVDRNGGELKRKSFDSAGAAAALAATIGGPAIAFKQDRFYFVASLSGNGGMVRAKVWKVIPRLLAIAHAIGDDGLSYPLNTVLLLPEQDKAADQFNLDRAAPVDAAGMRSIAGVKSDEEWAAETAAVEKAKAQGTAPPDAKNPERAQIPPERQEAFIEAYFRARAAEVLGTNLRQLLRMEEDFKPGSGPGDGKDVSPGAKALIATTKEEGAKFRQVLEDLALAQRYYDLLQWRNQRPSGAEVTVEGKKMNYAVAMEQFKTLIKAATEKKDGTLSRFPMLALMVERERVGGGGTLKVAAENAEMFWKSEIEKPTLAGKNQYDVSAFGQGASDEALRKEFYEKLCAVEKAVRQAATKVLGEGTAFLYGMAGLRTMVLADLAGNPELRAKAEEILKSHAIRSAVVNVVNTAIEIGLMFVPGVGPLLSAAAGLGQAAQQASQSLDQWSVSKASVDPTQALVDQQEASDSLFWDTVFLAAAAADFGAETAKSLAKGGKALTEEEEIARKHGSRPYTQKQAAARKLVREAEERKLWQAPDPEAAKELAVKLVKPDAEPLEKEFTEQLATLGINVSDKGVVTGHSELSILARARKSWHRVRTVLLSGKSAADKKMGEYLMWTMIAFRKNSSKQILEASIAEVTARYPNEAFTLEVKPTGSVSLTSDADWTVSGPYASEVVEVFNRRFREHILGCESATAFDTNVYTRPSFLDTPFDVAGGPGGRKLDPVHDRALIADQEILWREFSRKARGGAGVADGDAKAANIDAILAEAEKLYKDDFRARMAHVNNFNQETASHMKYADTCISKGKGGLAEWEAYKQQMLKDTLPENLAHVRAVLQEAELRVVSYQKEILLEINKNRPEAEWITPEQLADYTAKNAGDEAYERVVAARNRIHERKLGVVSEESKAYAETRKKFEALRQVWESGKATPEQQAELLRLQGQLHAQAAHTGAIQSEALYFAAEGYQSQGAYQLVVQSGKKLTGLAESPVYGSMLSAQARDACFELLGFVRAHSGSELDDILSAAKNLERANYAYLSHPLAKGGSPGVLALAGRVMIEKGNQNLAAAKALVAAHYSTTETAALKAFARDMQAAGAQLRGQMARVSGQPVTEIEEAWMRAVQSGASKTLLMYAVLATSKGGAVGRGTGGD